MLSFHNALQISYHGNIDRPTFYLTYDRFKASFFLSREPEITVDTRISATSPVVSGQGVNQY